MGNALTIVCANVGDKWSPVWVERLYRMVEENCSVPFEFRCITDRPDDYPEWGVPLSREVEWVDKKWEKDAPQLVMHRQKPQGCWAKLDAFLPQFNSEHVICLDLDIVICGDLADRKSVV